jgi:hypothetical protein
MGEKEGNKVERDVKVWRNKKTMDLNTKRHTQPGIQ